MMKLYKRITALAMASAISLSLAACGQKAPEAPKDAEVNEDGVKTITYRIRHDSTDEKVVTRSEMIMNGFKMLEEQDPTVHFEFEYLPKLEVDELALQFQSKAVDADLFSDEETAIGQLVKGGIIQPVDWFLDLPNVKGNIFENVEKLNVYEGHCYGLPIDMAVCMVYANKDALKKLGWTDEDIAAWPEKVKNGEWTLDDMTATCKEAIDKGIVKYGFMTDGVDRAGSFSIGNALGINSYDREQNKLIFNQSEWLRVFQWWDKSVHEDKIIPASLPSFEGTCKSFWNGEVLFFSDVSGYEYWQRNSEMSQEEFQKYYDEHFTQALMPSADKGTPAQAAMKLRSMFVYSTVEGEKLEYLKKAINLAYTAENQVANTKYNGKLSALIPTYDLQEIQDFKFVNDTKYMPDYTTMRSSHPDFKNKYNKYGRTAVEAIMVDGISPEEAVEMMMNELKFNVDDSEIIYK